VLAGLTRNEETTFTSDLPGMTGDLAPIALLTGGADSLSTNLSETLIFKPHSAFRKRPQRTQDG
jgi:hypothetical protein